MAITDLNPPTRFAKAAKTYAGTELDVYGSGTLFRAARVLWRANALLGRWGEKTLGSFICLGDNGVGDEGARAVAEALQARASLYDSRAPKGGSAKGVCIKGYL